MQPRPQGGPEGLLGTMTGMDAWQIGRFLLTGAVVLAVAASVGLNVLFRR